MVLWDIFYRIFWTHGGNHVVEVHEHVHEDIEQSEKGRRASWHPADTGPHRQGHDAMMNDVKETVTSWSSDFLLTSNMYMYVIVYLAASFHMRQFANMQLDKIYLLIMFPHIVLNARVDEEK